MIRMIVADDEKVIIKGIKKLLDWENLGIEIIGEYNDSTKALEGILAMNPDIALLDINMPKMSGMDILKEINGRKLTTRVIFVSGFQEFAYAREALIYGAEDYLLKPIIKEELVKALEKCIARIQVKDSKEEVVEDKEKEVSIPYGQLIEVEETSYITVVFEIIYNSEETVYEKRLVQFSLHSFLEQYMEKKNTGIVFIKKEHSIAVLKGMNLTKAKEFLLQMIDCANQSIHPKIGVVIGKEVDSMGMIVEEYTNCLMKLDYFFFADQLKTLILQVDKPVFMRQVTILEWKESVDVLLEAMLGQNEPDFKKRFEGMNHLICILAEGKKEDACFYYCNVLRLIEESYVLKGLIGLNLDMKIILEESRKARTYEEMAKIFCAYLERYKKLVANFIVGNEKRDIIKALEYIEKNYMKNITLEVLADVVHMNASYFSTYFKKHMNLNFKDYLNKVRMEHAMTLLLTTDLKIYNIAERVGFRDARSFNELFIRQFNETPGAYRKRVAGKTNHTTGGNE